MKHRLDERQIQQALVGETDLASSLWRRDRFRNYCWDEGQIQEALVRETDFEALVGWETDLGSFG